MKIAIAGCGSIAQVHAAAVAAIGGNQLVGFADIKSERAEAFSEKYGGTPYHSLEEMLDCEQPDVLHICTPHYLHVPMAVYGLKKGVHVFMEKPPVMTQADLEKLQRAAKQSDRYLGFCFQNRYNPCVQAVKELLASGRVGDVKGARGIVTWNRGETYYTESDWRGRLETEGGGVLINQAIHTMDLLVYLLGKPLWTEAQMQNHHLKGIIEVEDTMEACIGFEGKNACFYATSAYCEDVPPLIELSCEMARIRIEDPDATCFYRDGHTEKLQLEQKKSLGKSYWGSGHRDCIADFYRAVETETRFALDLEHVKESIGLLLGIYRSAREHCLVELAEDSFAFGKEEQNEQDKGICVCR